MEGRVLSNSAFIAQTNNFVCVRLVSNLAEDFFRKFGQTHAGGDGPLNVALVFLSPDGDPITPGLQIKAGGKGEEIQWKYMGRDNMDKLLEQMRKIVALFPGKEENPPRTIPWQPSQSNALFISMAENRRMIGVITENGEADPETLKALESQELLRRFANGFTFLKVERTQLSKVASEKTSLAVFEIPKDLTGLLTHATRLPPVLEQCHGPYNPLEFTKLLVRHLTEKAAVDCNVEVGRLLPP